MKNGNEAPKWLRKARAAWPEESAQSAQSTLELDPEWGDGDDQVKRWLGEWVVENGSRVVFLGRWSMVAADERC